MPVPGFLTSFADKAQSAFKDSSLAQHIPGATATDGGSTQKNPTLGQIQHQFRQLQQNYSTTTPVQKIITAEKGVNLDVESLSRNTLAQSKVLYMWGKQEQLDVKDVSDRLGFLNYVAGSLASTLAGNLDAARAPLKELRDKEVTFNQRRNVRVGLQNQIGRLEHSQEKGLEKRIAELKEQFAKAEKDDEPIEKEHEILLRKALKESEQQKFQALREYGEKLCLLSQAADALVAVLPSVPPSSERPYAGTEETGTIRASLQHSLDHWKPGQTTLTISAGANLDRSHSLSFGETHAEELKQINTAERHEDPAAPPRGSSELGRESSSDAKPTTAPAPVSTQDLGSTAVSSTTTAKDSSVNPPASTPSTSPSVAVSGTSPGPVDTGSKVPYATPALSETGQSSSDAGPTRYESAEEEKKRLEREEREKLLHGQTPGYGASDTNEGDTGGSSSDAGPKRYESAEDEKKRLEREEREKLLHGQTPGYGASDANEQEGETPPPYQDI